MEKAKLMRVVESELSNFEEFFKSQGNSPLVRPEKAVLRTYLVAVGAKLLQSTDEWKELIASEK